MICGKGLCTGVDFRNIYVHLSLFKRVVRCSRRQMVSGFELVLKRDRLRIGINDTKFSHHL